jgi:uncharacterized repeat protein (TIGR02543 family)
MDRRLPAALIGVLALTTILVLGNATAAYAAPVSGTVGGIYYTADDADVAAGATVSGYVGPAAVTIPDSVTLGADTYAVTAIGNNAMQSDGLTSVTIPDSVTTIGDSAFSNDSLSSVIIPDSVTSIGDSTFFADSLTSLTIPDSVTGIGPYAFAENELTSLAIGDSVTSIGDHAFYDNRLTDSFNDLTSISIPGSVSSIGDFAFADNSDLVRVEFVAAAPATIGAATGGDSLGDAAGLRVYYKWAYDAAQAAGGFTTPTWQGYTTVEQTTVAFNTGAHGSAPATEVVTFGSPASRPSNPTAAGYAFTGWYTSAALTTKFNFADPITANTTLYAGWGGLATTGLTISPLALTLASLLLVLGLTLILVTRRKRHHNAA